MTLFGLCCVLRLSGQDLPPEEEVGDQEEYGGLGYVARGAGNAVAATVDTLSTRASHRHCLTVMVGGGVQTVLYKVYDCRPKVGGGVCVDLRYRYYPTNRVGLTLGVSFATHCATLTESGRVEFARQTHVGSDGRHYDVVPGLEYDGWRERQRLMTLTVPVGVALRTDIGLWWGFEAGLHIAPMFVLKPEYETLGGKIREECRGSAEVVRMPDNLSELDGTHLSGRVYCHRSVAAAGADVRFLRTVAAKLDLVLGLYATVALASIGGSDIERQYKSARSSGIDPYVSALDCSASRGIRPLMAGLNVGVSLHGPGGQRQRKVRRWNWDW